jgi:hypothetical protein
VAENKPERDDGDRNRLELEEIKINIDALRHSNADRLKKLLILNVVAMAFILACSAFTVWRVTDGFLSFRRAHYQRDGVLSVSSADFLRTYPRLGFAGTSESDLRNAIRLPQIPEPLGEVEKTYGQLWDPSPPFFARDTLLVTLNSSVSPEEIQGFLKRYSLTIIGTVPSLGIIRVKTGPDFTLGYPKLAQMGVDQGSLWKMIDSRDNVRSANQVLSKIELISEQLQSDENVAIVSGEFFLTSASVVELPNPAYSNITFPSDVNTVEDLDKEVADWGIGDIEADRLWAEPQARDAIQLGILDTGFSRHEDISFAPLSREIPVADHGNHVAGIACGEHNGRGVLGVIPNCTVKAVSGGLLPAPASWPRQELPYHAFGGIIGWLDEFLDNGGDAKTLSISLGYNWRAGFGLDPQSPGNEQMARQIEVQSRHLVYALKKAAAKGVVLFSAAGNDSLSQSNAASAKYASPFNWASIYAREHGGPRNSYIVTAHDRNARTAYFANAGADISCPGRDVLSAVAYDSHGAASDRSYGLMSGTSMATPYCAAGFALLKSLLAEHSNEDIIDCILFGAERTDGQVPRLKMRAAYDGCLTGTN